MFEFNIGVDAADFLKRWQMVDDVYKSDLTPKPGPLGGSVSEVKPPAGSHEKRPLLQEGKKKRRGFNVSLIIQERAQSLVVFSCTWVQEEGLCLLSVHR